MELPKINLDNIAAVKFRKVMLWVLSIMVSSQTISWKSYSIVVYSLAHIHCQLLSIGSALDDSRDSWSGENPGIAG